MIERETMKTTQRVITSVLLAAGLAMAEPPKGGLGADAYDIAERINKSKATLDEGMSRIAEQPAAEAVVRLDPKTVTGRVPAHFIGYNIEDLSYELHPGLCAQMLYGESFEDEPDVLLPDGWEWHAEPQNADTPKDPDGLRKWRGAWSIEDGVVELTGCRQRRICTDRVQMTDGEVSCDVMQPAHERNHNGPGLLVCWKPAAYYYVRFAPEGKAVVLSKGDNPGFVQGAKELSYKAFPYEYGKWYNLRVAVKAGLIRVSVDGQELISYQDKEPLTGGVGLESSFTVSLYKNLVVKPDGQPEWRDNFASVAQRPYAHREHISRWWDVIEEEGAQARFDWSKQEPYNTDRCQRIENRAVMGRAGVYNTGLHNCGLAIDSAKTYEGRVYLRGQAKQVTVALQSRDGRKTYASQTLEGFGTGWKRYDFALAPAATDGNARFALWLEGAGAIDVDQAVLMPAAAFRYKGQVARKDLAEKLFAGLGHLRFGGDMINTWGFDWEDQTKDPDKRRQYLDGWNYHKSAMFGVFEFLDTCAAAGIVALPNLGEHLKAQALLNFVEYCNGGENTPYGARRIRNGHPKPYGIKYLMYGNGQPDTAQTEKLLEGLPKVDPSVKVIVGDVGHVPWTVISENNPEWAGRINRFADKLAAIGSRPEVDVLGSHLLWRETVQTIEKGFSTVKDGKTQIYSEEVNGSAYNWRRGLDDALIAITSEQLGGKIWGHAFCNAFQANGHLYEWNQGHIHFTPDKSWCQPAGWVVRLLGENTLPCAVAQEVVSPKVTVPVRQNGPPGHRETTALSVSACRSEDGKELVVKVVNLWGGPVTTRLHVGLPVQSARATVMSCRDLDTENTYAESDRLAPKTSSVANPAADMVYTFEPASFTVIRLTCK